MLHYFFFCHFIPSFIIVVVDVWLINRSGTININDSNTHIQTHTSSSSSKLIIHHHRHFFHTNFVIIDAITFFSVLVWWQATFNPFFLQFNLFNIQQQENGNWFVIFLNAQFFLSTQIWYNNDVFLIFDPINQFVISF